MSHMVAERCARERIREWTVEETVEMPVPKIQERIGETEYMQKVVEQVIEVPRTSSRNRTLQCTEEQILDVLVPETAKQLMEVPETVSQDRIKQRTVEQIVDVPVTQVLKELAEVSKSSRRDGIQQRSMEQSRETPTTSLAEMIVEVPVIQTPERTQQVMNTSVQHIVDTVEVEKPKIIDETVQKPTIQEKINQVTKHVEVPLVQFLDKVEEIPVVAQRQIPIVVQTVQKTIEIPQLQCIDDVIDVPVVLVTQVPQV